MVNKLQMFNNITKKNFGNIIYCIATSLVIYFFTLFKLRRNIPELYKVNNSNNKKLKFHINKQHYFFFKYESSFFF